MSGVVSTSDTPLQRVVAEDVLERMVPHIPVKSVVVLPTAGHRTLFRRAWAQHRRRDPVPRTFTMPRWYEMLATQLLAGDWQQNLISDHEASLLLDVAVRDAGVPFRPRNLSISRIIRWKQELLTPARLAYLYPPEERPPELASLTEVVAVWQAYEHRKNHLRDRGDVVQSVLDALAISEVLDHGSLLVLGTHGLALGDRTLLHVLAEKQWEVGIRFAVHHGNATSSTSAVQWLVAHGWHHVPTSPVSLPVTAVCAQASQRAEVRAVLASVKELWLGGLPLARMAVVVPDAEVYGRLFAECSDCGVPLNAERATALSTLAQAQALHAVCALAYNGWKRSDVERLAQVVASNGSQMLLPLSEAAATLKIRGGHGAAEWLDRIEQDQSTDRRAQHVVAVLANYLQATHGPMSAEKFCRVLIGFGSLVEVAISAEVRDTLTVYQRTCERLFLPDTTIREHARRWWHIVRSTTASTPSRVADALPVLSPNELRLQHFDHVFAVGVADGILPRRLHDVVDETIMNRTQISVEEEQWADVLASASGGNLTVTYPKQINDDPCLPSPFLLDVTQQETNLQCLKAPAGLVIGERDRMAFVHGTAMPVEQLQHGPTHEGITPLAADVLQRRSQAPLSPSRVDTAADCLYRHYVLDVLGAAPLQEADELLTPLERGNLMHYVARSFFDVVRGGSVTDVATMDDVARSVVDLTTHDLDHWMPILLEEYHRHRNRLPTGYLFSSAEESLFLDTGERPGILRRWLAKELSSQQSTPFRPLLLELEYSGPLNLGFATEDVRVKIDRIDVAIVEGALEVAVIDYKTTKQSVPAKKLIASGSRTQPPLYVLVAEQWFAQRGLQATVVTMRYHTFGKDVRGSDDPSISTAIPLHTARDQPTSNISTVALNILQGAQPVVESMRSARYPVAPSEGVCDRCDVYDVCRIDHWGPAVHNP